MKTTTILLLGAILALGCLAAGCSDDDSPTAPALTIDTAPPAPPATLTACDACTAVKLSWAANDTDTDLAGYVVYRTALGQTWQLTVDPIDACCYLDRAPLAGPAVYAVSAIDRSGNESARTTFLHHVTIVDDDLNRP